MDMTATSRRTIGLLCATLCAFVTLATCAVAPADAHNEAFGHLLKVHGQTIEWAFKGNAYGQISIPGYSTTDTIQVTFLATDSTELPAFPPPHTLQWVLIDTTKASVQQVADWAFTMKGKAVGSTLIYLRLYDVDHSAYTSPGNPVVVQDLTGVGLNDAAVAPILEAPAPSPFTESTMLRFALSKAERVQIGVFDAAGRRIASLLDTSLPAGAHEVRWQPAGVAPGVYFLRLESADGAGSRRVVLAR